MGPLAALVCYDISKKNPRYNILMIVIATSELYGSKFKPLAERSLDPRCAGIGPFL
jgi:hypothetical protein